MIQWKIKKQPETNLLDPLGYKIGTILEWANRADFYHVNWVEENAGPFKATFEVVNALKIKNNDRVLDVACGTGAVSKEILSRLDNSGILVGIDFSRAALSTAG